MSDLAGAAVVSCHVETPLDDRAWAAFARFQERRPGGFPVAALIRPPDPGEEAGREDDWLERARAAAARGPLGHHTHWGGVTQARPLGGDPAERVLREGRWLRERGLAVGFFAGGGWYLDGGVAAAAAELGYVDCTATTYRLPYLEAGAARLELPGPARIRLPGGALLPELPATHSLGTVLRALLRPGGLGAGFVHVHFHDWDLLDRRRALALESALRLLARRRRPLGLDAAAERLAGAPEVAWDEAFHG